MSALPPNRPQEFSANVIARAAAGGLLLAREKFAIVGCRGYFKNTMGRPGVQERGIWDDAAWLISEDACVPFNFNTDASRRRDGHGFGPAKGMAMLKAGLYHAHRFGLHKGQYEALIQTAGPVTVIRDGNPPYEDTGMFGINIHHGGQVGTSSLGCQTVPLLQWPDFISTAHAMAERAHGAGWRGDVVPYFLYEA